MPYITCPDGKTYSRYDQSPYVKWCICEEEGKISPYGYYYENYSRREADSILGYMEKNPDRTTKGNEYNDSAFLPALLMFLVTFALIVISKNFIDKW
jgi:hypothetical protein